MTVRAKQRKHRQKREDKKFKQINSASHLTTTRLKTEDKKVVVLGFSNGKIIYSSKPLRPGNYPGTVAQRWVRRAAKYKW